MAKWWDEFEDKPLGVPVRRADDGKGYVLDHPALTPPEPEPREDPDPWARFPDAPGTHPGGWPKSQAPPELPRSRLDRAFDEQLDRGALHPKPNVPWGTPNVEAAAYAHRGPGIFGKALGALGLDASGRRAATTWPEAMENTAKGTSLLNFAHDVYQAAKRLKERGGLPPEGDPYREQAPIDAFAVAGTAGLGSLAGESPPGAFGTFVWSPLGGRACRQRQDDWTARA
jgi:hypothetical protein